MSSVGSNPVTAVDRPYAQQAETRAAARRRVEREPQAELLIDMLGLGDESQAVSRDCPFCGLPLPDPITAGGYKRCIRVACKRARKSQEQQA